MGKKNPKETNHKRAGSSPPAGEIIAIVKASGFRNYELGFSIRYLQGN